LVEFTVHVSSTALVVLSMTSTTAVSVPLTVALVFAARFDTVGPLAGIASESSLLAEKPLVAAGQAPVFGAPRPVKFRLDGTLDPPPSARYPLPCARAFVCACQVT
jgi:hypothetical protein